MKSDNGDSMEDLLQETNILVKLNHPNIIKIFGVSVDVKKILNLFFIFFNYFLYFFYIFFIFFLYFFYIFLFFFYFFFFIDSKTCYGFRIHFNWVFV